MSALRDPRIVALLAVYLSRSVSTTLVPPCLPSLAEIYGVTYGGMGSLMATFFAAYTLSVLLAATVGRVLSRRTLLIAGLAFQTVGTLGIAAAGSLGAARVAAVAYGLGGLADLMATAILADLGGRSSARLLTLAHGGFALGAVTVPALAGVALDAAVGPRTLFLVAAAMNLGMLIRAWTVRDVEPKEGRAATGTLRRLWAAPVFRAGMLVLFLYILAEVVASVWLPTWLADRFGASPTVAAAGLTAFWGSMLVARVVFSPFVDRLPPVRLQAVAGTLATLAFAAMLLAPTVGFAFAGIVGVGLSLAVMVPVLQALIVRRFPGGSVQALGLFGLASGLAGMASPWVVGRLADRLHGHFGLSSAGGLTLAMAMAPLALAALLPALLPLRDRSASG
jgi:FHS family glucose/mannose:H+ symporter-like MFS transporter